MSISSSEVKKTKQYHIDNHAAVFYMSMVVGDGWLPDSWKNL